MKVNIKFSLSQISRIQIIVLVIITLLTFLYSGLFLYKNFYKTIASTEEIFILRSQIALEKINTALFNKVIENLENKKIVPKIDWTTFINPFLPYVKETESEKE